MNTSQIGKNEPLWKKLGYSSYRDYIKSTEKTSGNVPSVDIYNAVSPISSAATVGAGQNFLNRYRQGTVYSDDGDKKTSAGTQRFPSGENVPTVGAGLPLSQQPQSNLTPATDSKLSREKIPADSLRKEDSSSSKGSILSGNDEAGFGAKYQGNDFLEWYRTNYGSEFDPSSGFSRPQGMSDVDWAIGNSLYNSYLTGRNRKEAYDADVSEANERYQASIDALDENKRDSQQSASIMLDKLMKYLPISLRAQGLGGLGVSETAALQAYNNYRNSMGEIESGYSSNRAAIDANRNSALTELQRAYQNDKTDLDILAGEQSQNIFDKYYQADKQAKDSSYSDAYNTLTGSTSSSADELLEYVDRFKGRVSEEQYNTLQQVARQIAQKNMQAEQKSVYDELLGVILDGTFNTAEELSEFLNPYKDRVSEDQWNVLQQHVRFYKNSDEEKAHQEELKEEAEIKEFNSITESDIAFNFNGGTMKDVVGDNFSVKDADGKVYRVENGGEESSSDVKNAARNLKNGSVFGYGGQIYLKLNGRIYRIQKRRGASNSHSDYTELYDEIYG